MCILLSHLLSRKASPSFFKQEFQEGDSPLLEWRINRGVLLENQIGKIAH